jgi:peptidoglycan/xylan/chitin deacetylase (PgdA/CDA1 family)
MTSLKSKLYREGKNLQREIGHKFGLYNEFYKMARGSRILIYHGICTANHTKFNPIFLTLKTFEAHLRFYKKHFNVVSLDDYYQQKFAGDKFNICLTFDDGFANNIKYVLPLLERYEMPATFFVTAIREAGYDILWNDFLGIVSKYGPQNMVYRGESFYKDRYNHYVSATTGLRLAEMLLATGFAEKAEMMKTLYSFTEFKTNERDEDYWLQMTPAQIQQLATSPFATIGAHGHYHNDLSQIAIADAETEMVLTKQYLESLAQKPVDSFAFPYGHYTPQVVEKARQAGYRQLLATDFTSAADHNDATMRERFTVNPFISTNNQMYATVKRRYE